MGLPVIFLAVLLLQSALSLSEDVYEGFDSFSPEDDSEVEPYNERKSRTDKFLRFGRRFWDYDANNDVPYDDSEVPRPPRTGRQEKNDQFIRFGRSKEDSLRFSVNPQQRTARDKSSFLRFGRSITEDNKKKRAKRETVPVPENIKRHENYLRFGRNSNFMRFGRSQKLHHGASGDFLSQNSQQDILERLVEARNEQLIRYLSKLLKQLPNESPKNNLNEI